MGRAKGRDRGIKEALYRIWCGVNRLGDTSAFVIPAGQLLLTRRGKTRMYTVGIVFEFYTCSAPLKGNAASGSLGEN